MRQDDLEAELAESLDVEQLEVYADYLQSIGDPRGELIAFDLHGVDDSPRRAELTRAWLGRNAEAITAAATIEAGFIVDLALDARDPASLGLLDAVLSLPGGGYVQGVTWQGGASAMRAMLARLSAAPRRWLTRFSIQVTHPDVITAVDDALAAQLVRATPRLEALEVWGRRVFGELAHPGVRSLRVTGVDAIGALIGDGPPRLSALAVLDLALCVEYDERFDAATFDRLLPAVRLPKLRRLDLSRNEPGMRAPHYLGGPYDPFALLARCGVRRQLTHVRMPSLRMHRHAETLGRAIADLPALRELVVVRAYQQVGVSPPPRAQVARPWPWLPADLVGATRLSVRPGHGAELSEQLFSLALAPLLCWLEGCYDEMPPGRQIAWRTMFEGLYSHVPHSVVLSRRSALSALETFDDADGRASPGARAGLAPDDPLAPWRQLRDELRAAPDNATIGLELSQ